MSSTSIPSPYGLAQNNKRLSCALEVKQLEIKHLKIKIEDNKCLMFHGMTIALNTC